MRFRRGRVALAATALALLAACAPEVTPATPKVDPRLTDLAAQLSASLGDPEFVAQLGETDQERADAVASMKQFIADPGGIGFDTASFDARAAADAATANALAKDAQRTKDTETERAAKEAQGKATQNLVDAPNHDEVVAQGPEEQPEVDGESRDTWSTKSGLGDVAKAFETRLPQVFRSIADGTADGDPLAEVLRDAGYGGSGTIEKSGPCVGRTGERRAPKVINGVTHLRPGTIFTPTQDAWAGTTSSPRPVYSGDVQTRKVNTPNGPIEQLLVEGQLVDADSADPVFGNVVQLSSIDEFMVHVTVQGLGGTSTEYWANHLSDNGGMQAEFLCYSDDAALPMGSRLTRGYYRVWVPIKNAGGAQPQVSEPGFQIRTAVSDSYWVGGNPYSFFFGGDVHTVHLGPKPLAHHEPATAALGATLNTGFLTDTNGQSNDDLESIANPLINSTIVNNFHLLDGTGHWALGGDSNAFGVFGFHINDAEPGTANTSMSILPSNGDDEHQFVVGLELRDFTIKGTAGLLLPCYFRTKLDARIQLTGAIDIHDTNRAFLLPDVTVKIQNIELHNQFWQPVPVSCNIGYAIGSNVVETALTDFANDKLTGFLEDKLPQMLSDKADVAQQVTGDVALPNTNGFLTALPGFDDTCAPYGCNGTHTGDVALVAKGLEASADLLVTDRKYSWAHRRFPFSYHPSSTTPVSSLIRDHLDPGTNDPYSMAAFVSGDTINQLLRSLTEGGPNSGGGVLDLSIANGAPLNVRPSVTPIFLNESLSNKTLGLFVPELRVDGGGVNRYAAALAVGVDVTFDAATGTVDPASIGPDAIAAGLAIATLRCDSFLWSVCGLVPTLVNTLAEQLGGTLLPALTHNTLGQLKVPQIAGFPVHSIKIRNADGNLGLYITLGTPYVIGTITRGGDEFYFDANEGNFPEGSSVTYDWVIRDIYNANAIVFQGTTAGAHLSFPKTAFHAQNTPPFCLFKRRPSLQVTATATSPDGLVTASFTQAQYIDVESLPNC